MEWSQKKKIKVRKYRYIKRDLAIVFVKQNGNIFSSKAVGFNIGVKDDLMLTEPLQHFKRQIQIPGSSRQEHT